MKNIFKLLLLFALCSCEGCGDKSLTPAAYKYKLNEDAKSRYSSDTTAIRPILIKMLGEKIKPFNLKMYDRQTDLFIDSLVYSPDQLRMIVFVISRNSTSKMLRRENDSAYYYDAYYLYCSRDNLKGQIKVYDRAGYGLVNFYDDEEIREALRDYCFNRMMRNEGPDQYYNINDIRFWKSEFFEWVLNNSKATTE